MNAFAIVLLACGLAVDSAMVALAYGLATRERRRAAALKIAAAFGVAQGALATAGWWSGAPIAAAFERLDHWVAFGVLLAIAIRTIREGSSEGGEPGEPTWARIAAAALATSVDAFAAGFGLRLIDEPIAPVALATAVLTAIGSLAAFSVSARVPASWRKRAHWIAGLTLIAIGVRILVAHPDPP